MVQHTDSFPILLDGKNLLMSLPIEKQEKALKLINEIMDKKKATVKQLQVLMGYLNFLTKAIFAGQTFTHHMYAKFSQCLEHFKCSSSIKQDRIKTLKLYHHV